MTKASRHPLRRERVIRAIEFAANEQRDCPTNGDLATTAGLASPGAASSILKGLEADGLIVVARGTSRRVVTIVATGKRTAGADPAPHWRDRQGDNPIDDAVQTFRQRERVRRQARAAHLKMFPPEEERELPTVYRDPCPRCGVRGDIGCAHSSGPLTGSCFV